VPPSQEGAHPRPGPKIHFENACNARNPTPPPTRPQRPATPATPRTSPPARALDVTVERWHSVGRKALRRYTTLRKVLSNMSVQGRGWADDPIRGAGGRRHYNAWRRHLAQLRRLTILDVLTENDLSLVARGTQAFLARTLGVSEATISRDMRRLFADACRDPRSCPLCGCRALDDAGAQAIAAGIERLRRVIFKLQPETRAGRVVGATGPYA
jgi:hypothetical protein